MSKFVFKMSDDSEFSDDAKVKMSFAAEHVDDIMSQFVHFLQGCGYDMREYLSGSDDETSGCGCECACADRSVFQAD